MLVVIGGRAAQPLNRRQIVGLTLQHTERHDPRRNIAHTGRPIITITITIIIIIVVVVVVAGAVIALTELGAVCRCGRGQFR